MKSKVLIVGSGGREHALAWKLSQSPKIDTLFVAPGNGGTAAIAQNVDINVDDISGLVKFVKSHSVNVTIIGPDDPLALGIVDSFRQEGLRVFGPTQAAAQIEASKAFSKQLMQDAGVPTAKFSVFSEYEAALKYVYEQGAPIVIKASGLALGKGVYVCSTLSEAETALKEIMLDRLHAQAGNEVVIEEYLDGPEISLHAFCDGERSVMFPAAQDHKTIGDGNTGKNTGGMGAIAPIAWVHKADLEQLRISIVQPTLQALQKKNAKFTGLLYPGLKMTSAGPRVLEFNARFGDPETQCYMRLLKTDLFDIINSCIDGTLSEQTIEWETGFAACVVLASGGYPDTYRTGFPIYGLEEVEKLEDIEVFHAGTTEDGGIKTSGGRVLGVTAIGTTLPAALDKVYAAIKLISFEGMQFRKDIGKGQAPNAEEAAS